MAKNPIPTITRRADELKNGDTIISRVTIERKSVTGYIVLYLEDKIVVVPPDAIFEVVAK